MGFNSGFKGLILGFGRCFQIRTILTRLWLGKGYTGIRWKHFFASYLRAFVQPGTDNYLCLVLQLELQSFVQELHVHV